MRLVIIESPFAGDVEGNLAYARAAMADCLRRGEAPFASHALYTQPGVLDDDKPDERTLGIEAGLAWGALAAATVVYTDRGMSRGMRFGIERAEREGRPVEYRSLVAHQPVERDRERFTRLADEPAPTFPPSRTCAKCGMTAMAFVCSERGCPENGGAAYPWTIYPEKPDGCPADPEIPG